MREHIQKIEVCCGTDCVENGSDEVLSTLETRYGSIVTACGCVDVCEKAVNVIVDEKEIFSYSTSAHVVEKIENSTGEVYESFDSKKLDLSDDFLGDL